MTILHIYAPQPIRVEPAHQVLAAAGVSRCRECAAFVKVTSRSFEWREYDESTYGAYDRWYLVAEHYECKRCGFESGSRGTTFPGRTQQPVKEG